MESHISLGLGIQEMLLEEAMSQWTPSCGQGLGEGAHWRPNAHHTRAGTSPSYEVGVRATAALDAGQHRDAQDGGVGGLQAGGRCEETPETPPSSRAEGLLFLHGLVEKVLRSAL